MLKQNKATLENAAAKSDTKSLASGRHLPPLDGVVELRDVSVKLGERTVLDGISFKIEKGEFVYLIGRTGAGKSTLLKLLYGDLLPEKGTVRVERFVLNHLTRSDRPFLRRRLGIVFQDFQLLPDRSVLDNLIFVMEATGWTNLAKMKERAQEVLMQVGLATKLNAMPHQLSGGEQQRTVLARALVNDPALIIADEPTGNLDPEVTHHIMSVLHKLNRSGTAVLMATHEHDLIRKYPARVLELNDGQLTDKPAQSSVGDIDF